MQTKTKFAWLASAVALLAVGLVTPASAAEDDNWTSPALCGDLDTPETGIQGDVPRADQDSGRAEQGYNCGLALLAFTDLGGAGGGDVAWSNHCAYVKSGGGVQVVDVSDPANPVHMMTLPGTGGSSENIHAVTTPNRAILVATRSGPLEEKVSLVDVFDVKADCTNPQRLSSIRFPHSEGTDTLGPVHNVGIKDDGTKVYGSIPLQEADITNMDDPSTWTVRNFHCTTAAQHQTYPLTPLHQATLQNGVNVCESNTVPPTMAHEFAFNQAGTRMFIADQQDYQFEGYLSILDMTVWPPMLISQAKGEGHNIRRMTIDGQPYLLHSDEGAIGVANPCAPEYLNPVIAGISKAYISDVSDENAPQTKISALELAIQRPDPKACTAQLESGVRATAHYQEPDDYADAHFAMAPTGNAGFRIWNVRDPHNPVEVAYFNPGMVDGSLDSMSGHTHYDARTGTLWLGTSAGLWVLELEPQVREALGLPPMDGLYPNGRPAR